MRRKIGQPRFIDPSLIEEGDEISVEHREDKGITMTLRGIVDQCVDRGATRLLITKEGATLLAWSPGRINRVRVTLFAREEPDKATMFDLPEEIRERMRA